MLRWRFARNGALADLVETLHDGTAAAWFQHDILHAEAVINIEDTYSVTNSTKTRSFGFGSSPAGCLQHGQAVRLRQHEVDDQQIRFQLFQQADGANAVTSRADYGIPIRLLQGNAELPTKLFAAVCQQDPIHFFHVTTLLLVDSLISAWMYKRCF